MTSLFERALGEAWDDLHPQLQERYGLVSDDDRVAVGVGTMDRISRGALALPALYVGAQMETLFPEGGTDVPFDIESHAFRDAAGNEALTLRRTFETDPTRTFVDVLRWDPGLGSVVDLLGTDGRIVAEIDLVVEDRALGLDIGRQWLRIGDQYQQIPALLAAESTVRDYYDEAAGRYRASATITQPLVGHVFGWQGRFDNEWRVAEQVDPAAGSFTLPGGPA